MTTWTKIKRQVVAAWLPGICLLCDMPGTGGRDLCSHCHEALPWNHRCCTRCAEPLASGVTVCLGCSYRQPPSSQSAALAAAPNWPINTTIAPLLYQGAPKRWVQALKFHQHLVSGRLMGDLLADALAVAYPDTNPRHQRPHAVVPIPLHWQRLMRRGLNQSQVLAKSCAHRLRIPLYHNRLYRQSAGAIQHELDRKARLANLQGAFRSKAWAGEHIALVDDVVTTGATGLAAARACLAAGAARVDLWCLCKTPPPLYVAAE